MKPTMIDIAKACGVSKTLVSRIINKDITLKIPNETREKVLKEIERQNYIPNFSARSLKNEQFSRIEYKIGFATYSVSGTDGHPYFSHVFSGAMEEATKQQCTVVPVIMQFVGGQFTVTCPEHIDGLILPTMIEYEELKKLLAAQFKYIVSMDGFFTSQSDIVETSICKSLRLGLEHLYALGYREFGLLSGGIPSRVDDFFAFAEEKEIVVNDYFVLNCYNNSGQAYMQMSEVLKKHKPPRAIMCHNDEMAIGCMHALIEAGWQIPEDVAVVGHDDIDIASFAQVPLTTVRIYKEEIGRLAVTVLIERLHNQRKVPIHVEVAGKLIKRQSCGAKGSGRIPPPQTTSPQTNL